MTSDVADLYLNMEDIAKMVEFVLEITTLSFIEMFTCKCWVLLLAATFILLIPVFLWIISKVVSWKYKL